MGLFSGIGNAISGVGHALDLPDLGIGKALGGSHSLPGALQGVNPSTFQGVGYAVPSSNFGAPGAPASPVSYSAAATGGGGTSGGGGGGSAAANPGMAAFLQGAGLQIGNLQNDIGSIDSIQNAGQAGINASYNDQSNALNNQYSQGKSANQAAQVALNNQRAASLGNLGSQLRGMYNDYNNQLGVGGGGNSSAEGLISSALTNEANAGRFNVGQQFGTQQTGLNQNAANLDANFQQQQQALSDWKTQTLQQIIDQYTQTRQQLQNQILSVQSDEARTALYMKDQNAANQALSAMQQTVGTFGNAAQNLQDQYTAAAKGIPQAALNTQGYQVQQFSQPDLPGLNYSNNAAPTTTTSNSNTYAPVGKTNQQTPQVGTIASLNG